MNNNNQIYYLFACRIKLGLIYTSHNVEMHSYCPVFISGNVRLFLDITIILS